MPLVDTKNVMENLAAALSQSRGPLFRASFLLLAVLVRAVHIPRMCLSFDWEFGAQKRQIMMCPTFYACEPL